MQWLKTALTLFFNFKTEPEKMARWFLFGSIVLILLPFFYHIL